ncbi:MAG: hypothetical protein ACLPPV_06860 [Candidatus Korobacteraceae bacterium]|jgi:hypothetical protein
MNTTRATPPNDLEETDKLLNKFEVDNIPAQYREYCGIKRNNFFAASRDFPRCGSTTCAWMQSGCGSLARQSPAQSAR